MGNKLTRHRHRIDDKYTRPQGLYEHTNLDYRKLKRLIINHKLAPCFPGVEDPSSDLDECPICFLVFVLILGTFRCVLSLSGKQIFSGNFGQSYPSLNRSKCCMKSICTGNLVFFFVLVFSFWGNNNSNGWNLQNAICKSSLPTQLDMHSILLQLFSYNLKSYLSARWFS